MFSFLRQWIIRRKLTKIYSKCSRDEPPLIAKVDRRLLVKVQAWIRGYLVRRGKWRLNAIYADARQKRRNYIHRSERALLLS